MMKQIVALLFLTLLPLCADYTPFLSFSSAKHQVQKLYSNHKTLPLSHQAFIYTQDSCALTAFTEEGFKEVNWYHLIPKHMLTLKLPCQSQKLCKTPLMQTPFSGFECCQKRHAWLHRLRSDLFLIVPMQTARFKRLNIKFLKPYKAKAYPKDFFYAFHLPLHKRAKGEVARMLLYAIQKYKLAFSKHDTALLKKWHQELKPSPFEYEKNQAIFKLQGTSNPYIKKLGYNHKKSRTF